MAMLKRETKAEPRRFTRGPSCDLDEHGDPVPRDRSDEEFPLSAELADRAGRPLGPQCNLNDWDPEDGDPPSAT